MQLVKNHNPDLDSPMKAQLDTATYDQVTIGKMVDLLGDTDDEGSDQKILALAEQRLTIAEAVRSFTEYVNKKMRRQRKRTPPQSPTPPRRKARGQGGAGEEPAPAIANYCRDKKSPTTTRDAGVDLMKTVISRWEEVKSDFGTTDTHFAPVHMCPRELLERLFPDGEVKQLQPLTDRESVGSIALEQVVDPILTR